MKAVIYHGWGSTSQNNWFSWLKNEMQKKGHEVYCPDLPNTQHPRQDEWIEAARKLMDYDQDTVMIGHSLGTILIMRLLERMSKPVKAIFLVAGFDEHLEIPELKNFFETHFDYAKIRNNAGNIYMLSSDNDHYIPLFIAERLARSLKSKLIIYKGMGHLSAGTGNMMFPELRDLILNEHSKSN